MREFSEQERNRREKVVKFKELSINPFGDAFEVTSHAKELTDEFSELSQEELENVI